ncbi:MAG: hypothetical protein LBQ31_02175 [Bacteroidales bacterium]|jgi:hypothetical protein|nr:hypothetical protein [Bacteroidales bacterium]
MKQFLKLLRFELKRNKSAYIILASVMVGAYLVQFIFQNFVTQQILTQIVGATAPFMQPLSISKYGRFFAILIFIAPFMMYKHLFNPIQGVSYTMLPANDFEKFLTLLVQCVIIVPLGLLAIPTILNIVVSLIGGIPLSGMWSSSEEFRRSLPSFMLFQATAIWGVLFFKTKKLWKTILVLLCVAVVLTIGLSVATYIYFSNGVEGNIDLSRSLSNKPIEATVFSMIILLLWAWGFWKMKRQEL